MKFPTPLLSASAHRSGHRAFTLIELLVVISIIALLAAMIVGLAAVAGAVKVRNRTKAELAAIQGAIEKYHKKFGFYPPSNPNNAARSSLYYELTGQSLDNAAANSLFGVKGIVNTQADEETKRVPNFFPTLGIEGTAYRDIDSPNRRFALTAPSKGPDGELNTWRYVSGSPTNNTETYDLWAEVIINNKVEIIGNW